MRVVFGSRNPSKLARMRELFRPLGIELVAPDENVATPPEGADVQANAVIKARCYATATSTPCLANDYGLRLDGLAGDEQPGAFVRRRVSGGATDEEMMAFYIGKISALGGSTKGTWTGALAIAFTADDIVSMTASHSRTFVSEPSEVVLPGEPLASLQIDPTTGRYLSELPFSDRAHRRSPIDSAFVRFVEKHLASMRDGG